MVTRDSHKTTPPTFRRLADSLFYKLSANFSQSSNDMWIVDGVPFASNKEPRWSFHSDGVLAILMQKAGFTNRDEFRSFIQEPDAASILKKRGLNAKEIKLLTQTDLPPDYLTDYALSQGWVRVADYDIEAQRLDSRTLSNIAKGLSEHYGGYIPPHLSFNLESVTTGRFYSNVPVDVIESSNPGELLSYRMGSGYNYGYMAKAGQVGYLSKISQRGEFWLSDGVATYADGDIGDYNHEGVVIDAILSDHDMDFETFEELASRSAKNTGDYSLLTKAGFTEDEIAAVRGTKDARDYALKHLGWVRVNGNSVQTWAISREILNDIANGLWDAYDEECGDYTYTIEVSSSGALFTGVPFSVIASGDPSGLMRYKER